MGQDAFEILGEVTEIELIAKGRGIRRLKLLQESFGGNHWRKLKGLATVRLINGSIRRAEVHWYDAHGVGRRMWKIKRFLI